MKRTLFSMYGVPSSERDFTSARRRLVLGLVGTLLLATVLSGTVSSSAGATGPSLSIYLDAPFVHGSYVAPPYDDTTNPNDYGTVGGTSWTSFNDNTLNDNTCTENLPPDITIGTNCFSQSSENWGGATPNANDPTPTFGGPGSRFARFYDDSLELTFGRPMRYFGVSWPSGTTGNTFTFYSGNNPDPILSVSSADVITKLGVAPADSDAWAFRYNDPQDIVTAVDGTSTFPRVWYFGNPREYSSLAPTSSPSFPFDEPFVYLHMFAQGGLTFDKVVLTGGGFEFDNLVVSRDSQVVAPTLVFLKTIAAEIIDDSWVLDSPSSDEAWQSLPKKEKSVEVVAAVSPELAKTGGSQTGWDIAVGFFVALGGALMVFVARRRRVQH